MSRGTNRRIFISDIHMGDRRSANQTPPFHGYCWFSHPDLSPDTDRPGMLADFLEEYCINDGSVAEVVIVGDLFDEWVCPVQYDPTEPPYPAPLPPGEQYGRIAAAPQNAPVVKALKNLALADRLVYVPGNHDMFAVKEVVRNIFPGICCPDAPDGHHVYGVDGIWTEHGHWYGMFNAPYPAGPGGGFAGSALPLGYFITRINAQEALQTGRMLGLTEVFKEWVKHIPGKAPEAGDADGAARGLVDAVLMDLFDTLVSEHAYGREGAVMNGSGGVPGLVKWEEVKARYHHTWDAWPQTHPGNVGRLDAIESDAGRLDQVARSITLEHEEVRIVVCGHTHDCGLMSYEDSPYPPDEVPLEAKRVYANAGAWTNDTPVCTFVETELRPDEGKHLVSLRKWVRDSATGRYRAEDVQPGLWVVADTGR